MSSLTGIAQFTNRFAQNIMGYEQDKKDEAERVADKQYNRNRQQQADLREQQNHDVTLEGNQITLNQNKIKNKEFTDSVTYEETRNQLAYLDGIGADEQQKIDVLAKAVNSNQKLPYKIEFERDVTTGNIIQRQGPDGKPFYFQTIIDKETGQELGRKGTTFEEATGNYNKLQNAGAIEDEIKAAAAARAAKTQEVEDELSLYKGKALVDDAKDADKAQRDYGYTVSLEGIKFGNQTQRDETLHGYAIDKQNNQAGHAQSLAYIQGELAAGRIDQQTYNRMEEYLYKAGVDQGQTPGVTLGKDRASQVNGIISSLTGTESSGNSGAFRTNTNGKSYGGLIQMGDDRLKDYATATRSRPISASQFRNLPPAQQRAVNEWHINDLIEAAQATGAVGKVINGTPVTLGGLVAVAHLGGKGGMNKFVQTNGRYNPKDQLGTSLTDYLVKHRSSTVGGVQTTLTQPLAAKPPKGGSKKVESVAATNTAKDYDAVITKGLSKTQKSLKSLGLKPDAASAAILAETAKLLRDMGKAGSAQEVSDIYGDVYLSARKAIPASKLRQMTKAQRSALTNQIIYSIAGVSSAKEIRQAIERFNPAARGGGKAAVSAGGLTLNLPGQQVTSSKPASQFQAVRDRKQQEAADAFNNGSGKTTAAAKKENPTTNNLRNANAALDWD